MLSSVSQMQSLREVASRINSGANLAELLFGLVKAACDHGGWSMGSIMAVDLAHGYAHVSVRHDPTLLRRSLEDRWELATSPALVALRTGQPVYIADARASDEFPGYRKEAFERDYRSVLVTPLTSLDAEGRPMVLSLVSRSVKPMTESELTFMAMIAHLGAIAVEREHSLRAERRAADQQRRALHAQGGLLQEVLSGGSVEVLAERLRELLECPVLVVDFSDNRLVAAGSPMPGDDEGWKNLLASAQGETIIQTVRDAVGRSDEATTRLNLDHAGGRVALSLLVERLTVDGDAVGALALLDDDRGDDLRRLMLESAKFALSVQMMRSVIRFKLESRTLTELFFEIIERRWRDPDDILRRAGHLGLSLTQPLRMLVVDFPGAADKDDGGIVAAHQGAQRLLRQHGLNGHVIAIGTGLACLLRELHGDGRERLDRFTHRLTETLRQSFRSEPIVVMGGQCRTLGDYSGEWERIWRMVRIARSFGRTGVLSALDFGPVPMLIGAADSAEVRSFVDGSIGSVVAHDREHGTPYLETLAAYLRAGCRAQPCADVMGLHVTTLRYRMNRIAELFQINVDTAESRFTMELALKMHGVIEGRIASAPEA